eukprot:13488897-Alexandrium_andersonii.AAC.1
MAAGASPCGEPMSPAGQRECPDPGARGAEVEPSMSDGRLKDQLNSVPTRRMADTYVYEARMPTAPPGAA